MRKTSCIRVFIGTEVKTEIARKVLEMSILRRTEAEVEFIPMIGAEWEYPTDGITVGTGFSLRRWMIPAYCGWKGRAIYLDADQLVFADIRELWQVPDMSKVVPHRSCWMTYQPHPAFGRSVFNSSVMVIDCEAARGQWVWRQDELLTYLRGYPTRQAYLDIMYPRACMNPEPGIIPAVWNHLDAYHPGKTKLLHYTKEDQQPWYNPAHPLADLWQKELVVAINCRRISQAEFQVACDDWNVKQDWRKNNGLHPHYAPYINSFRSLSSPKHRSKGT